MDYGDNNDKPSAEIVLLPGVEPNTPAQPKQLAKAKNKGGRPKGSKNKIPSTVKEAFLQAAAELGDTRRDDNGRKRGRRGLLGYCQMVMDEDHKIGGSILARIMSFESTVPVQPRVVVQLDPTKLTELPVAKIEELEKMFEDLQQGKFRPVMGDPAAYAKLINEDE